MSTAGAEGAGASGAVLTVGVNTAPAVAALDALEARMLKLGLGSFTQLGSGAKEAQQRIKTLEAQVQALEDKLAGTGRGARQAGQMFIRYSADIEQGRATAQKALQGMTNDQVIELSKQQKNLRDAVVARKLLENRDTQTYKYRAAADRDALAEQRSMMAGFDQARATYRKLEQARDVQTYRSRVAADRAAVREQNDMMAGFDRSRARFQEINQRRDYEAYRAREEAAKRLLDLETRYLQMTERQRLQAALRARRLIDGGRASSLATQFAPQTITLARARTTDQLQSQIDALRRTTGATRDLTDAQAALHSAFRGVGGALGGLWLTYSKFIVVMGAAAAATKVMKDSVTRGLEADFQSQFASILQTKGPLDLGIKQQILDELIDVSRRSVFTVSENAEAMKKLALAGVEATTSLKLLDTAANVAIFSQTSLAEATTRVLDAVNNFALASDNPLIMASNFERVANVMAVAASTVNASFTDIAKAMENVSGVAGTFNIQIEEAAVLLQSMARTGIRGPKAGTFLRNFFDEMLGAPNSLKAEKAFAKLGIERYDPDNYVDGFGAARYIDELKEALRKLDFVEQQNVIRAISNQRSRRLLRQEMVETNSVLERTVELQEQAASGTATGKLAEMAASLSENAQRAFQMAQAAYDAAVVDAFDGNQDAFKQVGDDLRELFNSEAFRDFASAGASALADFAAASTSALKSVVEWREPLEYLGNAALWVGIATGVRLVGTALMTISATNPILLGIAAIATGWKLMSDTIAKSKTAEHMQMELEKIESAMNGKFAFIFDNAVNRHRAKELREQIAKEMFDPEAMKIQAARFQADLKQAINELELEFHERSRGFSGLAKAIAGVGATDQTVKFTLLTLVKDELDDTRKQAEALSLTLDQMRAASLDPTSIAHYQDVLKQLYARLSDLEERQGGVERAFKADVLRNALGGLSDGAKRASFNYEEFIEKLEETNRELKLGEEGMHRYEQEQRRVELAALEAAAALNEMTIADGFSDPRHVQQAVADLAILRTRMEQVKRSIQLSEENFDLKQNPPAKQAEEYEKLIEKMQKYAQSTGESLGVVGKLTEGQKLLAEATKKYGRDLELATGEQRRSIQAQIELIGMYERLHKLSRGKDVFAERDEAVQELELFQAGATTANKMKLAQDELEASTLSNAAATLRLAIAQAEAAGASHLFLRNLREEAVLNERAAAAKRETIAANKEMGKYSDSPKGESRRVTSDVKDARKLAESEYQQVMQTIELAKDLLDVRKNTREVSEAEYQQFLDALADKEIEAGLRREQRVQQEIAEQLKNTRDPYARDRLNSQYEQSLAQEAELRAKAYRDAKFREVRNALEYTAKAREMIEQAEIESGRRRLDAAEQFAREWTQKYGDTLASAFEHKDIATQQSLGLSFQVGINTARFKEDLDRLKDQVTDFRGDLDVLLEDDSEYGIFNVIFGNSGEIERLKAERLAQLQEYLDELKARLQQLPFGDGTRLDIEVEIRGVEREMDKLGKTMSPTLQGISREMSDYLASGIVHGFERGESPAKAFSRILGDAVYRSLSKSISLALDALLSGLSGATGGGSGGFNLFSGLTSVLSRFGSSTQAPAPVIERSFNALGNAFDGERVRAFANGGAFTNTVVDTPTPFSFMENGKRRLGEMGEAGPEAIMPLKRGNRGELGVRVAGSKDVLPLTRDSSGSLAVKFAHGGVFDYAKRRHTTQSAAQTDAGPQAARGASEQRPLVIRPVITPEMANMTMREWVDGWLAREMAS